MKTILITGGSGLVGQHLTSRLLEANYEVLHLSRTSDRSHPEVPCYTWDIDKQTMQEEALQKADKVVHLAGANVNEKWTEEYKKEIEKSRVQSTQLLYETVKQNDLSLEALISASAVGYYGDGGDQWLTEDQPPADDFLGTVCKKWETAARQFEDLGIRTVLVRTGVALSTEGGALPEMATPVKFWVGAPLGSGQQYMPWIHIKDLCGIYQKAVEDENMNGPYNAAAPNPVTNREMTKALGRALGKPVFMPSVPKFVLKLMMGEMASVVLNSVRASSEKMQKANYKFQYPTIEKALEEIYNR